MHACMHVYCMLQYIIHLRYSFISLFFVESFHRWMLCHLGPFRECVMGLSGNGVYPQKKLNWDIVMINYDKPMDLGVAYFQTDPTWRNSPISRESVAEIRTHTPLPWNQCGTCHVRSWFCLRRIKLVTWLISTQLEVLIVKDFTAEKDCGKFMDSGCLKIEQATKNRGFTNPGIW